MVENPTVNLSALCISCAKIACCSSELKFMFLYAGGQAEMQTSNWSRVTSVLL